MTIFNLERVLGPDEIRDANGKVWDIDDAVEAEWDAQFERAFPSDYGNEPQPAYEVDEDAYE